MGGVAKRKPCGAEIGPGAAGTPPSGYDPDRNVRRLKARLARISRAAERRERWHRLPRTLLPFAIVFCVAAWGAVGFATLSPWSARLTGLHLVSALGCNVTWAIGLAPALRGQPGYWSWHDGDKDGIACEPWHRHRR